MIVSLINQPVKASFVIRNGQFHINVPDASYVRAERVLVDMASREVGVVLHEGYHALGGLPEAIQPPHLKGVKEAMLYASLPGGRVFRLSAPLFCHMN